MNLTPPFPSHGERWPLIPSPKPAPGAPHNNTLSDRWHNVDMCMTGNSCRWADRLLGNSVKLIIGFCVLSVFHISRNRLVRIEWNAAGPRDVSFARRYLLQNNVTDMCRVSRMLSALCLTEVSTASDKARVRVCSRHLS